MGQGRTIGFLLAVLAFIPATGGSSQSNSGGIRLGLDSGISLPVGESSSYFGTGYFAGLSASLGVVGPVGLGMSIDYAALPLVAGPRLDLGRTEAKAALSFALGPLFSAGARAGGGVFYGILSGSEGLAKVETTSAFGGSASAELWASFVGIRNLELRLHGGYSTLLGVWNGLSLGLAGIYRLEPAKAAPSSPLRIVPLGTGGLTVGAPSFGNIFPVFYKYYNDHPIGTLTVTNPGPDPVTDISASFYMRQYMDAPKACATIPRLGPGETATVELLALFTDRVLEITEGTVVSADIGLEFTVGGAEVRASGSRAVRILDRNAMSWLDDRCAAAYVTAKDPAILSFAKNVVGEVKGAMNDSITRNLQMALALHEALDIQGLGYVVDPKSSYASNSASKDAVDFLQFPRQTLEYRGGDCDDLSILYAALLESVGIETAFVTVPGHIYVALALDLAPRAAAKAFSSMEDLITREDRSWLPIEVTDRSGGFLRAWELGAREWREAEQKGQAAFLPVHDAWTVFEPVGLPGLAAAIPQPPAEALVERFRSTLDGFIGREIAGLEAKALAEVERTSSSPPSLNALGVLYARYGFFERAEPQLLAALQGGDYAPALVNLGNIENRRKNAGKARDYFERAYAADPKSPLVVLSLARSLHEVERYDAVGRLYAELGELSPALASQYAWLNLGSDGRTRAVDLAEMQGSFEWAD